MASSPPNELRSGDDGSSPAALVRRATIGDPVYDNPAIARQRRKTSIVACERCRRRKIRCDGSHPCATCARFGVRCSRRGQRGGHNNSDAEQAALEYRVIISITGPNGSMPSSPLAYSPSPSLFSGTSRASSPDPFSASSLDFTTGVSSTSMSQWAVQDAFYVPMHVYEGDCLGQLPGPLPEKERAEVLADYVFQARAMRMDRTAFKLCFEAVYDAALGDGVSAARTALSTYTPYSLRVARAFVFLTLAIGLRLYASTGGSNSADELCYSIAMQQMQRLDFWEEDGSNEVAGLLTILYELSTN